MPVIPLPAQTQPLPGQLQLPPQIDIGCRGKGVRPVGEHLQDHLVQRLGLNSICSAAEDCDAPSSSGPCILLHCTGKPLRIATPAPEEAYELEISEAGALIRAPEAHGLFNGVQSLIQLLPAEEGEGDIWLDCLRILDAPRFRWRGVLLDVGRHFFPVPFIKRFLTIMAWHKCNVFHWHLTEDQGWRLEVKGFPQLAKFGAWRRRHGKDYGGFYSQDEVRDIVAYAAERFIEVVPEIELPGHCGAALASYPHLGCTGRVTEVPVHWGVHDDVYCAGKETTFEFLEAVLKEVMTLFPSRYIHIGGDECPKSRWHRCQHCQARIRDCNLADEFELQSWFIGRINTFLKSQGKQLIGWDEILEGGLTEGAIVMSWRGITGGVRAARGGHDVIMTPTSHCYFDYKQSLRQDEPGAWYAMLPLEVCYAFDPVPPEPLADPRCAAQRDLPPAIIPPPPPADSDLPVVMEASEEGSLAEAADVDGTAGDAGDAEAMDASEAGGSTAERPPDVGPEMAAEMEISGAAAAQAADWTLPAADAHRIIGGQVSALQANVWTEYIADEDTVEYMLLPRLCATAEALWSPKGARDWPGFQQRVRSLTEHFDALGIRYRPLI